MNLTRRIAAATRQLLLRPCARRRSRAASLLAVGVALGVCSLLAAALAAGGLAEALLPLLPPGRGGRLEATDQHDELELLLHLNASQLSAPELETLYFKLAEQQHLRCPLSRRLGRRGDGGWDVCFAAPFDIRQSRPCVAFSFGVGYDFAFDDQLAASFGCRVYMFDPSMAGVGQHRRTSSSWFYAIGVGRSNGRLANGWRLRSLCSLLDEFGRANATVDIVKLDVELAEWSSLAAALADGCLRRVKQLMLETHALRIDDEAEAYRRFVDVLLGLFRIGFRSWRWRLNPVGAEFTSRVTGRRRRCCREQYLLNAAFLTPSALLS